MGSHAITYAVVGLAIAALCLVAGFFWGRSNVQAQIERAVEKEHVALDAREFTMRTQLEDAIAELAKLRPLAEELGRVQKRLEREQAKYAQMKAEFNASIGVAPLRSAEERSDAEPQLARTPESADEAIQKLLQSLEVFNAPNGEAGEPTSEPALVEAAVPIAPVKPIAPPAVVANVAGPAELPRAVKPPLPAVQGPAKLPARPAGSVPPQPVPVEAIPVAAVPVQAKPLHANPAPVNPAPVNPVQVNPAQVRNSLPNLPSKSTPPPSAVPPKPASPGSAKPGQQPQNVDEWQEFARQLEALTGKKK